MKLPYSPHVDGLADALEEIDVEVFLKDIDDGFKELELAGTGAEVKAAEVLRTVLLVIEEDE